MTLIYEYGERREQIGIEKGLEKGREEGLEKGLEKGREEGLEKGLEKGREEGLEKGREENTENIIRNLLISGIDPQEIAKTTKVPLSKINKIKEKYEL